MEKKNGGIERAKTLTEEQRKSIASKAGTARWEKEKDMPKATHKGEIHLGDIVIPCAVLDNGERVLTENGIAIALGATTGLSGAAKRRRAKDISEGRIPYPTFLSAEGIKPFTDQVFNDNAPLPIEYKDGRRKRSGFSATMLPKICEVWLRARDAGALLSTQHVRASMADTLMRGLAHIGIVALVDEATGYQEERDRTELNKLLSVYLSEERLTWAKRFPDEFYRQLYRLHGWKYPSGHNGHPSYVGRLTNTLVYDKLPVGVLDELQKRNPTKEGTAYRKWKHHQFLSEDIGQNDLRDHLLQLVMIMRISPDWKTFEVNFENAFPSSGTQQGILFDA